MRVVALGGCGGMGRYAVPTVSTYDFVDEVVVADLDGERAASFAKECGPKATSVALDVEDADALAKVLSGADVVLNTTGPFYRLGVPILHAAIQARCHYIDINDDWEPTLEMLSLDGEARQAGITAIVGMGASPGVSNLLAVKAMSQLDSVEDLITGWSFGGGAIVGAAPSDREGGAPQGGPPAPSAALVHWMHQCSGKIRLLRDGKFVDVAPIDEMKIEYPGIGTSTAWTVGHPEAVTLPLSRPGLCNSYNVMYGARSVIDAVRAIAAEIDAGRLTAVQGAQLLVSPAARQPRPEPASESGPPPPKEPRLPPMFALARGTRGGKHTSVGATVLGMPSGGMGGSTGVPMAVGLSLFAGGKIDRRGVCAPESVVDPDAFFDELAPLCSPPLADSRAMLLVTTSG